MSLAHQIIRPDGTSLADYNPERGLKAVAVAEAAEKHYARAKDGTKLYEAIEAKLGEQRKFVIWWDEQDKNPGSRKGVAVVDQQRPTANALGVDRDTLHRWRQRLKDELKFVSALEAAQERCRRVCEAEKGSTEQKGASGTGENEWYTPPEYLVLARQVLGEIDLDPASSEEAQKHVQASAYFTKESDGLVQEWNGRVWLNPPYAQPHIADFVSKMVAERRAGRVNAAIMLTHNYTDTAWFHEGASEADAICFTRGRVKFYDAKGNIAAPTQGQAFFYFGQDVAAFAHDFADVGFIVLPFRGEV